MHFFSPIADCFYPRPTHILYVRVIYNPILVGHVPCFLFHLSGHGTSTTNVFFFKDIFILQLEV